MGRHGVASARRGAHTATTCIAAHVGTAAQQLVSSPWLNMFVTINSHVAAGRKPIAPVSHHATMIRAALITSFAALLLALHGAGATECASCMDNLIAAANIVRDSSAECAHTLMDTLGVFAVIEPSNVKLTTDGTNNCVYAPEGVQQYVGAMAEVWGRAIDIATMAALSPEEWVQDLTELVERELEPSTFN